MDAKQQNLKKYIFVLVGPGGSGKSSLRVCLHKNYSLGNWKTVTTRTIREAEALRPVEEQPYIFLSLDEFNGSKEAGTLLEANEQAPGKWYGKRINEYVDLQVHAPVVTELEVKKIEQFEIAMQSKLPDSNIHIISCFLLPELRYENQDIIDRCIELMVERDGFISDSDIVLRRSMAAAEIAMRDKASFWMFNHYQNVEATAVDYLEHIHIYARNNNLEDLLGYVEELIPERVLDRISGN